MLIVSVGIPLVYIMKTEELGYMAYSCGGNWYLSKNFKKLRRKIGHGQNVKARMRGCGTRSWFCAVPCFGNI
jgi:hypothetical protein